MRVLVTNTSSGQAYTLVRCLRPYADRLIATQSEPLRLGFIPNGHAAYSRLVDQQYRVPDPTLDWRAGRIQAENTEHEQAFIAAILDVCEREKIDTIFPSTDAWVYVLSKNKETFEQRGIVLPTPDYETVATPLDKYRTIQCALAAGFPAPRTYLAESDADVSRIASELEPPWVIKLRFTSGGRGLAIVERASELVEMTRKARQRHGAPLVQEYIPGKENRSLYLVVDRRGQVLSALSAKSIRTSAHNFRSQSIASELDLPSAYLLEQATRLVRHIGWYGGITVQVRIDARDGKPKLMEMNPRLGIHLWFRTELGINEPIMCLKIARNEDVEPVTEYPLGCLLLKPIEDAIALPFDLLDMAAYRLRVLFRGGRVMDPSNRPLTVRELFASYRAHYLGDRQRRFSPQFRYALEDPLPSLLWSVEVLAGYVKLLVGGQLGR